MSTMIGKLLSIVDTRELIPGIELMVLNGRKILMTRIADISCSDSPRLTQPSTTTIKSNYKLKTKGYCRLKCKCRVANSTYNIPRISQVAVRPHEESHCNDLQYHFNCVNQEEHEIDLVGNGRDACDLLVDRQEKTICENYDQDYPVEPRIDSHNLNDPVPERIGD